MDNIEKIRAEIARTLELLALETQHQAGLFAINQGQSQDQVLDERWVKQAAPVPNPIPRRRKEDTIAWISEVV